MSIMEAVNCREGFQPRQTIYLIFGQDEEIGAPARRAADRETLQGRGIHRQFKDEAC